jgi:hypothetical protein
VEKYGTAGQAMDSNNIRRRKDAICMSDIQGKNTDTHPQHIALIFLKSSTKYFVGQQRKWNPVLHLQGNTEYFCIVDSYAKNGYANAPNLNSEHNFLKSSTKYFVGQERKWNPVLHLQGNTEYFCIVDSYSKNGYANAPNLNSAHNFLKSSTKYFVGQQRKWNPVLHLQGNTEYFVLLAATPRMVTRTLQTETLHIKCLCC